MREIDYKYTEEIVCPYCGYKFTDCYEYFGNEECADNIYCDVCEKEFDAVRNVSVSYTSIPRVKE